MISSVIVWCKGTTVIKPDDNSLITKIYEKGDPDLSLKDPSNPYYRYYTVAVGTCM